MQTEIGPSRATEQPDSQKAQVGDITTYRVSGRMGITGTHVPNGQHSDHNAPIARRLGASIQWSRQWTPPQMHGATHAGHATSNVATAGPLRNTPGSLQWLAPRLIRLLACAGVDYVGHISCSVARVGGGSLLSGFRFCSLLVCCWWSTSWLLGRLVLGMFR